MKNILVLVLAMCCIVTLVACDTKDNVKSTDPTSQQQQTDPSSPEMTEPSESTETTDFIPPLIDESSEYAYFEATEITYDRTDYIGNFPFFDSNEDFWAELNYLVAKPDEGNIIFENNEKGFATWDDIKDMNVADISSFAIPYSDYIELFSINFTENAKSMTVQEAILRCEWNGNGVIGKEKHIEAFFPEKADSISELFVNNYGQPTSIDVNMESGKCNVVYRVDNFELVFDITPIEPFDDYSSHMIMVQLQTVSE